MTTTSARTRLRMMLTADAVLYDYLVSDELVDAFAKFLRGGNITEDDVAAALLEHRKNSDARFTPAVVWAHVRRRRAESSHRHHYPPPQSLDGDPAREIPWRRTYDAKVSVGMPARDAYLAACAEHRCDPGDAFGSEHERERAYALIEQFAATHAAGGQEADR